MDTTAKYILMSEKAKGWLSSYYKGKPGDLYVGQDGKIHMVDSNILTDGVLHPDCIPLFRQDQLQKMLVPEHYERALDVMMWLWQAIDAGGADNWRGNESDTVEQLLLRFVMWEKFKNVWNEKVWSTTKKEWVAQQAE